MAAPPPPLNGPVGPDSLITIKILIDGQNRRFKVALRDLGANTLPEKLRLLLAIPSEFDIKFDRFSDSAGTYVTLDSNNPSIYKQLYRAAKAKSKLRLKATVVRPTPTADGITTDNAEKHALTTEAVKTTLATTQPEQRPSYLDTVLSWPEKNDSPAENISRAPVETHNVPGAFDSNEPGVDPPVRPTPAVHLSQPTVPSINDFSTGFYTIDCNNCNRSIPNEHYHCAICEQGDFDLCQECIDFGVVCYGQNHWLIKRFIHNGLVRTSLTETREQRKTKQVEATTEKDADVIVPAKDESMHDERTCNACVSQLPGNMFVTCHDCDDYDLCFPCLEANKHGHHPAHAFEPVDIRVNSTNIRVKELCGANRAMKHHATCDGCEKLIVGVRHKCLTCPDWDFCDKCMPSARDTHAGHRFAPIYSGLGCLSSRKEVHRGIYCDGPICAARNRKSYIKGDRYKCAVCHDTDFCASCEASPSNLHNKTHPLIKIRVPIRHVSITTFHESDNNHKVEQVGDRPTAKNAATETARTLVSNAATQVQTVAEVKPVEAVSTIAPAVVHPDTTTTNPADLQAWYEGDSTPDGSTFAPNRLVSQSWTLRNPGPEAWPAGCAVNFIGGDDMRNLDMSRPSSVSSMTNANRSNVLDYKLQPGKTAVFTVLLKSPVREGRAISYWRLKTPDGRPFGHKLWVDINVTSAPIELPIRSATSVAEQVEKSEDKQEGSTMIFPKLDKESPVSSIHDVKATPSIATETTNKDEEDQELLEDVESLEIGADDSDEEDFMTDEEYDILDASDEDFLIDARANVNKK